jgi:hypothetical protein
MNNEIETVITTTAKLTQQREVMIRWILYRIYQTFKHNANVP